MKLRDRANQGRSGLGLDRTSQATVLVVYPGAKLEVRREVRRQSHGTPRPVLHLFNRRERGSAPRLAPPPPSAFCPRLTSLPLSLYPCLALTRGLCLLSVATTIGWRMFPSAARSRHWKCCHGRGLRRSLCAIARLSALHHHLLHLLHPAPANLCQLWHLTATELNSYNKAVLYRAPHIRASCSRNVAAIWSDKTGHVGKPRQYKILLGFRWDIKRTKPAVGRSR